MQIVVRENNIEAIKEWAKSNDYELTQYSNGNIRSLHSTKLDTSILPTNDSGIWVMLCKDKPAEVCLFDSDVSDDWVVLSIPMGLPVYREPQSPDIGHTTHYPVGDGTWYEYGGDAKIMQLGEEVVVRFTTGEQEDKTFCCAYLMQDENGKITMHKKRQVGNILDQVLDQLGTTFIEALKG